MKCARSCARRSPRRRRPRAGARRTRCRNGSIAFPVERRLPSALSRRFLRQRQLSVLAGRAGDQRRGRRDRRPTASRSLNTTEDRNRRALSRPHRAHRESERRGEGRYRPGVRPGQRPDLHQQDASATTSPRTPVWIDLAYIEAKPFQQLTLTGGRMPNPFFSTDLVWDTDLRLEGVGRAVSSAVRTGDRVLERRRVPAARAGHRVRQLAVRRPARQQAHVRRPRAHAWPVPTTTSTTCRASSIRRTARA